MLSSKALKIRWIEDVEDDHPEATQVAKISQACFGTHGFRVPEVLRFMDTTDCIPKVAIHRGGVVGYMFYVLHRHVVEVPEIAVRHDMRRQGIGSKLVVHLIEALPSLRRLIIGVAVPENCLPGQLFLREHGFRAVRTLYRGTSKERYLMTFTRET